MIDPIDKQSSYESQMQSDFANKGNGNNNLENHKKAVAYSVLFAEFKKLVTNMTKKNDKIVKDASKKQSQKALDNKDINSVGASAPPLTVGAGAPPNLGDGAPPITPPKINWNDPLDILQKLKLFLQTFFSNCNNDNAPPNLDAFFTFMSNLGQHWDKLSPDVQKDITNLFHSNIAGHTLAFNFLTIKLQEIIYDAENHGVHDPKQLLNMVEAYLQKLKQELTASGAAKNPFIADLLDSIDNYLSSYSKGIINLINACTKNPNMSPDDVRDLLNSQMLSVLQNLDTDSFFHQIRLVEIQLIIKSSGKNSMLAILLLMSVVVNDYTNDQSFKISSKGSVSKKLKKIAEDINNLTNIFMDGFNDNWSKSDDVKKFMSALSKIQREIKENSIYFKGQGTDGNSCLQSILAIGFNPDPDPKKAPPTSLQTLQYALEQWNEGGTANQTAAVTLAQSILKGTTLPKAIPPVPGQPPVPGGGDAPGPGYNTITGAIKRLSNIYLDQSSFVVSDVQNIIALMNQGLGTMKSTFTSIEKLGDNIINNTRPS